MGTKMTGGLAFVAGAVFRAYAAVIFLEGRATGLVILAATLLHPAVGVGGLLGALTATVAALAFGYPRDLVGRGLYGVSPLLVGMAATFFGGLTPASCLLAAIAAVLTMVVGTMLGDWMFRTWGIGPLSLPFAAVATLVALRVPRAPLPAAATPDWPADFFRSLGAIFFVPDPLVGVLLFGLILIYSRVLAVLALLGFAVGVAVFLALGGSPAQLTWGMAGFNFSIAAMALGGVFLLPGPSATGHAVAAVAVTAFLAVAAGTLLSPAALPVFSWPFNLAVIAWVAALYLRGADRRPTSARGYHGPPEAMAAQRTMIQRLAWESVPLRLPVVGEWRVTQGVDGAPTHRPPWQDAWDFEVVDAAGFPFRTDGAAPAVGITLTDYYSFGAPVVAAADGVVVAAGDGLVDNEPGSSNPVANFGNHLIIRHGERLFSVSAHLQNGSLRPAVGETVRSGRIIARCGASGHAPRPHLHFQLQAGSAVGAATLPARFSQYVVRSGAAGVWQLIECGRPALHERVTALESLPGVQLGPMLTAGQQWVVAATRGRHSWRETWRTDFDLWGGICLRSDRPAAALAWRVDPRGLAAVSFTGSRAGTLFPFFLGNSRVPSHLLAGLPWRDRPGAAYSLTPGVNLLRELLLPLADLPARETHFAFSPADGNVGITARTPRGQVETVWCPGGAPRRLRWQDLTAEFN